VLLMRDLLVGRAYVLGAAELRGPRPDRSAWRTR
jgi:hypothetical protein